MIASLINACVKQNVGMPFGQKEINGSFTSLVNRGLIARKKVTINGHTKVLWQVTNEAVEMLSLIGIEVAC